ncbi:MAG: DUF5722 domain-containing protein [Phycisphaerae bacterium]|nr:DUF5722 domain-containing protein [Phycisphaerae bacterium]
MIRVLFVVLLAVVSIAYAGDIGIELDLGNTHHLNATALEGGGYLLETTGDDPFVMCKPIAGGYDPDKQFVFSFEYFCIKGLSDIQLYYGPPIRGGQVAEGPSVLSSEGWTEYSMDIKVCQSPGSWKGGYKQFRLDLGRHPGRKIQIRNIKLREPNEYELKQAAEADRRKKAIAEFDDKMKQMVEAKYPGRIERVAVGGDGIVLTINADVSNGDLYLCEVPIYQSPVGRTDFIWQCQLEGREGKQVITLDRMRGSHDRVFSSWILMRNAAGGLVPASHQRFAESIPGKWELTRDRPISKKGTAGMHGGDKFQYDDYKALGIHNCTKNILLNAIFTDKPMKGFLEHKFNGTMIYVNPKALQQYDLAMKEMDELKIVVSAIILISRNTPFGHPDCAPAGSYAMANVVEEKGWNLYAAAMDFLAGRYTRPDRKFGRITHWILHNEVDAGWIWTNAGEIPMDTYLDIYYRSMRTTQGVIRRYGDAGDVLISLTHYWTSRHNERCYAPKEMIDLLAKRSEQEGDFDWGLAYHPYPQNLRDPRTWQDRDATFDFQTKLITPKNLEVLDAYMRQESLLYDGKVRTIVLSEQGSNSPDYSEKSFRDQAAGLLYTWLKFEKMDSIESYVHHRWMDYPHEGGLNLGFWTNRIGQTPQHTKKPAWDVWMQVGTDQQFKAVEKYREVIGQENLENIPYKGRIR